MRIKRGKSREGFVGTSEGSPTTERQRVPGTSVPSESKTSIQTAEDRRTVDGKLVVAWTRRVAWNLALVVFAPGLARIMYGFSSLDELNKFPFFWATCSCLQTPELR